MLDHSEVQGPDVNLQEEDKQHTHLNVSVSSAKQFLTRPHFSHTDKQTKKYIHEFFC